MTGKLATCTEEHHWSSSRSSNRNLTENLPFCIWSSFPLESSEMDLQSALSWTQETSALSSFSPPAAPPCWGTGASPLLSAWTQPSYPETQGLTALRRESSRQLVTQPSLRAERPAPAGQRRFGAPCGPPEQSGQPRAHTAQRAPPEAALRRALRLEIQTEMEHNSSMTLLKTR